MHMSARGSAEGVRRMLLTASALPLCIGFASMAPTPARAFVQAATDDRMPVSSLVPAAEPRKFYPSYVRIDTVDDATVTWLRAGIAEYFPDLLDTESPYLFVSLFVDSRGYVVGAAAGPKVAELQPGVDRSLPAFQYNGPPFRYGGDSAMRSRADVSAERERLANDGNTLFAGMDPNRSVMGLRTVFPPTFEYDSTRPPSIFDPFLGTDPHDFQWDANVFLKPGMIGPATVEVHILMLKPGRSGVRYMRRSSTPKHRIQSAGRRT